ncbi:hypothetical protein CORC01_08186 [Colletotrichum orchidophilum]|uniref:Uncharacterized protein n=1 Tax=Colletotrichum orchidophilum TaxID=1209926 RepID=A0A1G4B567_9PEZI|nr:uncharacterized protein CORC01_08186 [Colletotrichum orchidophilum]OHE96588.1 hypothetical protein CORC01_08186 [Colletotrichum orchidophilum]
MVEFLIMSLNSTEKEISDADDQHIFRVSKIETACRFNKDHVANGAYCECLENDNATKEFNTNRETELHNTAAAMRRVVSQGYLFPFRGFWILPNSRRERRYFEANTQRPPNEGQLDPAFPSFNQCTTFHLTQPDLNFLDNIGNQLLRESNSVTVIPVLHSNHNVAARVREFGTQMRDTITSLGGRDQWERAYIHSTDLAVITAEHTAAEYDMRMQVCGLVSRLLGHDPGLTMERIISIGRVFREFLQVDGSAMINNLPQELKRLFSRLLLTARYALVHRMYPYGGMMLINPSQYNHTEYTLLRNHKMRLNDEFHKQGAIESVVTPLKEAEVQGLDPDDADCPICAEPVGTGNDPHAGMRIKCNANHVVGKNCWMKALRCRRQEYMEGLKCPMCGDFKLSDWGAPIHHRELWAIDVVSKTAAELGAEQSADPDI